MTGGAAFQEGEVIVPRWVDPSDPYPRDVPHPAGTLRQPIELHGPPGAGVPATYILTVEPGHEPDAFQAMADRARSLGWPVLTLESDHNAQRHAREGLVAMIMRIVGGAEGAGG
jgi:hypothetical protein